VTGPRSASTSTDGIAVGVVTAAHGVRGEVRVSVQSDVEGRFHAGAVLECDGIGPLEIETARPGTRSTIVRFRGYADRESAETLRGRSLLVSRDDSRRAVGDAYLWADLIGLRASDPAGADLGVVSEMIRAGETDVVVISRDTGDDLLVPAIASVIREVDVPGGRIVVAPQEEA
jgi:16S rRNA processing protein RimM